MGHDEDDHCLPRPGRLRAGCFRLRQGVGSGHVAHLTVMTILDPASQGVPVIRCSDRNTPRNAGTPAPGRAQEELRDPLGHRPLGRRAAASPTSLPGETRSTSPAVYRRPFHSIRRAPEPAPDHDEGRHQSHQADRGVPWKGGRRSARMPRPRRVRERAEAPTAHETTSRRQGSHGPTTPRPPTRTPAGGRSQNTSRKRRIPGIAATGPHRPADWRAPTATFFVHPFTSSRRESYIRVEKTSSPWRTVSGARRGSAPGQGAGPPPPRPGRRHAPPRRRRLSFLTRMNWPLAMASLHRDASSTRSSLRKRSPMRTKIWGWTSFSPKVPISWRPSTDTASARSSRRAARARRRSSG
jgi:hypothetical protein